MAAISILTASTVREYTCGILLNADVDSQLDLDVTFKDVVAVGGTCVFQFIKGDGTLVSTPGVIDGNKISCSIPNTVFNMSGLEAWVQFLVAGSTFTPLVIRFSNVDDVQP